MSVLTPLLLLAALCPAAILLVRVYQLDKIEKEPRGLLLRLVLFGALSGLVASFAETLLSRILALCVSEDGLLFVILENFLVVALVEEACKRAPVLRYAWKHPAFNYRFDAVVYCVFSALGFAALENILYVFRYGLSVALPRALLAVPGHFFFAVYMGIAIGEAKQAALDGEVYEQGRFLTASLLVPMLLHGFWDFALSIHSKWMAAVFYLFVLVFFFHADHRLRSAADGDVLL